MHPDELRIDDAVVRALIAEQFPQWARREVTRIRGAGTDNAIFRVGDELAARFPLRSSDASEALSDLELQRDALAEFAATSPFAAPRPVAIGDPGRGYPMPWSVQTWIDGVTATPHSVAGSTTFAADLADLILTLRAVPVRGRVFRGRGRGGELPDQDEWMQECLVRIAPYRDPQPLAELWARFRGLPPGAAHVMSHGDLIPPNLLVGGGRLVGILDAGAFGPADPSLDLVCAWHLLDAPARDALRERVAADDLEWSRGAAWAFAQAMGLVWYYAGTNSAMAELGDTTLSRLVAAWGVGAPPPPAASDLAS